MGFAQNSSPSFGTLRLWLAEMREEVSKNLEGNEQKPDRFSRQFCRTEIQKFKIFKTLLLWVLSQGYKQSSHFISILKFRNSELGNLGASRVSWGFQTELGSLALQPHPRPAVCLKTRFDHRENKEYQLPLTCRVLISVCAIECNWETLMEILTGNYFY